MSWQGAEAAEAPAGPRCSRAPLQTAQRSLPVLRCVQPWLELRQKSLNFRSTQASS